MNTLETKYKDKLSKKGYKMNKYAKASTKTQNVSLDEKVSKSALVKSTTKISHWKSNSRLIK